MMRKRSISGCPKIQNSLNHRDVAIVQFWKKKAKIAQLNCAIVIVQVKFDIPTLNRQQTQNKTEVFEIFKNSRLLLFVLRISISPTQKDIQWERDQSKDSID